MRTLHTFHTTSSGRPIFVVLEALLLFGTTNLGWTAYLYSFSLIFTHFLYVCRRLDYGDREPPGNK